MVLVLVVLLVIVLISRLDTATDLVSRDPELFRPLHVVNMTITDSPEESAAAAGDVLNLCKTVIMRGSGKRPIPYNVLQNDTVCDT